MGFLLMVLAVIVGISVCVGAAMIFFSGDDMLD